MALSINFSVCVNSACDVFTFTETTGAYSATNTGGWGAPNPTTGTITTAVLQVTAPSGTITNINLIPESFPSSNPSFSYDINSLTYADGKWEFLLYYYDGSEYYMKRHTYYFYCTTKCCVETMLANLNLEECDCCNDKNMDNYLYVSTLLDGLILAAKCQQEDNFTSIKTVLDKLCANSGCNTCK